MSNARRPRAADEYVGRLQMSILGVRNTVTLPVSTLNMDEEIPGDEEHKRAGNVRPTMPPGALPTPVPPGTAKP